MGDLKHLKYYQKYIKEQAEQMVDDEGNPIAAFSPPEDTYSFLFIDEEDIGNYKYPDGSSYSSYPTFEISKSDLEDWLNSNVVSDDDNQMSENAMKVKKENLMDYVAGKKSNLSPEDREFMYKFKNNVLADVIAKKIYDTDVTFSNKDQEPSTESFNTTFIILPVKND